MALTILVVEDSDTLRERLVESLRSSVGVTSVDQASSVAATRSFMATRWADVFVLDIALPDGTGIELLHAIRQFERPAVVIMLTNHSSPQYRRKCVEEGADLFLDKTSDFEVLTAVVARLAVDAGERP